MRLGWHITTNVNVVPLCSKYCVVLLCSILFHKGSISRPSLCSSKCAFMISQKVIFVLGVRGGYCTVSQLREASEMLVHPYTPYHTSRWKQALVIALGLTVIPCPRADVCLRWYDRVNKASETLQNVFPEKCFFFFPPLRRCACHVQRRKRQHYVWHRSCRD